MKFQTVRKGYDPSAVDEYIKKLADDDNNVITEQKAAIEQLKKQNRELEERLAGYDGRKEEIFSAFVEAQESSASLKRKAERLFEEEINRVKTLKIRFSVGKIRRRSLSVRRKSPENAAKKPEKRRRGVFAA